MGYGGGEKKILFQLTYCRLTADINKNDFYFKEKVRKSAASPYSYPCALESVYILTVLTSYKIGHSSRSSSIQRSKTTEEVSGNVKQFFKKLAFHRLKKVDKRKRDR